MKQCDPQCRSACYEIFKGRHHRLSCSTHLSPLTSLQVSAYFHRPSRNMRVFVPRAVPYDEAALRPLEPPMLRELDHKYNVPTTLPDPFPDFDMNLVDPILLLESAQISQAVTTVQDHARDTRNVEGSHPAFPSQSESNDSTYTDYTHCVYPNQYQFNIYSGGPNYLQARVAPRFQPAEWGHTSSVSRSTSDPGTPSTPASSSTTDDMVTESETSAPESDVEMPSAKLCGVPGCNVLVPIIRREVVRHANMHSGKDNEDMYCPWKGCELGRTIKSDSLKRHFCIHFGIIVDCSGCHKGFSRGDSRNRHLRSGKCAGDKAEKENMSGERRTRKWYARKVLTARKRAVRYPRKPTATPSVPASDRVLRSAMRGMKL